MQDMDWLQIGWPNCRSIPHQEPTYHGLICGYRKFVLYAPIPVLRFNLHKARPNNCGRRYADIYIPTLTLSSLSSKQVLLLNMSKTKVLRHIELNRTLDIAVAFTAATRALVAEMHTKGNNPYGKRPVGTAKRSINTTWQASTAVVHFTLHNTLPLWRSVSPSAATGVCAAVI